MQACNRYISGDGAGASGVGEVFVSVDGLIGLIGLFRGKVTATGSSMM